MGEQRENIVITDMSVIDEATLRRVLYTDGFDHPDRLTEEEQAVVAEARRQTAAYNSAHQAELREEEESQRAADEQFQWKLHKLWKLIPTWDGCAMKGGAIDLAHRPTFLESVVRLALALGCPEKHAQTGVIFGILPSYSSFDHYLVAGWEMDCDYRYLQPAWKKTLDVWAGEWFPSHDPPYEWLDASPDLSDPPMALGIAWVQHLKGES